MSDHQRVNRRLMKSGLVTDSTLSVSYRILPALLEKDNYCKFKYFSRFFYNHCLAATIDEYFFLTVALPGAHFRTDEGRTRWCQPVAVKVTAKVNGMTSSSDGRSYFMLMVMIGCALCL